MDVTALVKITKETHTIFVKIFWETHNSSGVLLNWVSLAKITQLLQICSFHEKWDLLYIHTAREQDRERDRNQWVLIYDAEMFTLVCDMGPGPILSYCANSIPCTTPGLVQCK